MECCTQWINWKAPIAARGQAGHLSVGGEQVCCTTIFLWLFSSLSSLSSSSSSFYIIITVLISSSVFYPFPVLLPIPLVSRLSISVGLSCHLGLNQVIPRQKKDLEMKCSGLSGICLFLVLAKKPVEVFMKGCKCVFYSTMASINTM